MLLSNLNLLAAAPGGVAKLRELILTLAVQGKLVPQDASDESASELLKKIRAENDRLISEGKIKRDKPLAEIADEEKPFELPISWEWCRLGAVTTYGSSAKAATIKSENWQRIATHFDLLLDRPEAVDAFEQTILQLAVRGLLVPQDPTDEPASVLLQKIRTEKDHLIAQGKIKRDKPLPPITDEEKPFELPQGWEWARLQQAYDVRDGTHDTPKYQATGHPLVTSKNIYGGVLDLSDVKLISAEDHEQISARSKVDRNDILFAMIGSIGNPVLVDTDLEFSVKNVALFKYYAPPLSCPAYLLLLLQTEAKGIRERAAGAVQSFVSLGQLRSAVVALPPLAEQSRIVVRVNELRALCAELRLRLSASQLVQSHLADALVAQ